VDPKERLAGKRQLPLPHGVHVPLESEIGQKLNKIGLKRPQTLEVRELFGGEGEGGDMGEGVREPCEYGEPSPEGLPSEEYVEHGKRVFFSQEKSLHHRKFVEIGEEAGAHFYLIGGWGIRTPDLQIANLPLYQLS
jgi:hypothetical protein